MLLRKAARAIKGFIVDPGGNVCWNASFGLTTALRRPVCGSSTTIAPSRSPSADAAADCSRWSRWTLSSGSDRFTAAWVEGVAMGGLLERINEK